MQSVFSCKLGQNWNPLNLLSFCKWRLQQSTAVNHKILTHIHIEPARLEAFVFYLLPLSSSSAYPGLNPRGSSSAAWSTRRYLDLGPGSPVAFLRLNFLCPFTLDEFALGVPIKGQLPLSTLLLGWSEHSTIIRCWFTEEAFSPVVCYHVWCCFERCLTTGKNSYMNRIGRGKSRQFKRPKQIKKKKDVLRCKYSAL